MTPHRSSSRQPAANVLGRMVSPSLFASTLEACRHAVRKGRGHSLLLGHSNEVDLSLDARVANRERRLRDALVSHG